MRLALKTDFRGRPPRPMLRANGVYYIVTQVARKRIWRSLHTRNKQEAQALAYRIWYARQSPTVQDIVVKPSTPLPYAYELHTKTERYGNLEESTRRVRLQRWSAFVAWCGKRGIEGVEEVTPEVAKAYLGEHCEKAKTHNNIRGDLAQVVAQACDAVKQPNPFMAVPQLSTLKGAKASEEMRAFTDDELTKIFDYIATSNMPGRREWEAACHIALATGLRFKDVCFLTWDQADKNVIEHVPFKTRRIKKAVLIRVASTLRAVLDKLPKTSKYVLPYLASRYTEQRGTKPFQHLLKRVGIVKDEKGFVGFHSFRSTFTTACVESGIDLSTLGGILGHTTKEQTRHYNKAAENVDLSLVGRAGRSA